jgi:hypothetical protein
LGWCSDGAKLLMIGAAKTQSAGVLIILTYTVNLNPGNLISTSTGGSRTSSRMFSEVVGGVGPYEYLWTIDNEDITINTPTADSTTFTASGFNEIITGIATLTVTDLGNGSLESAKNAAITFEFEVNPG